MNETPIKTEKGKAKELVRKIANSREKLIILAVAGQKLAEGVEFIDEEGNAPLIW